MKPQHTLRICQLLLVALLATFALGAHAEPRPYQSNPLLATVEGQPITLEDVKTKAIHDLTLQLYQQLQSRLLEVALERLAPHHPEIELHPKITVSEQQSRAFYKANNLQSRGKYQALAPKIREYLQGQLRFEHLQNQYGMALQKGWVTTHLAPPTDFLVKAKVGTAYLQGNINAKVMMLEFSDYQCPFCRRARNTLKQVLDRYQDRIVYGYRHFPLSFHTEADEAAIAVECAREQEKFLELHELLYENQKAQTLSHLKQYARRVKIPDLAAFDECLESERYRSLVDQDMDDGAEVGITGTPGFVIGHYDSKSRTVKGEVLSGAQPYQNFVESLEKYLNPDS
ncbi:MAG: thioredoxin domain-containing protein [SAR324 cluster bacterium]|nr:thioredoxin domain-containing protein [SAR324 cluster bacterium]